MPKPKEERHTHNLDMLDAGTQWGVLRMVSEELRKQSLMFEEATQRIVSRLDSLQDDQQEQQLVLKRNIALAVVSALDERSRERRCRGVHKSDSLESHQGPMDIMEKVATEASDQYVALPGRIQEKVPIVNVPLVGTVPSPDASPRILESSDDLPQKVPSRKSTQSLAWDPQTTDPKAKPMDMSFSAMKAMYGLKEKKGKTKSLENVENLHWCRRICINVVNHGRFEPICSSVMILCAVQIACEAHDSMHEVKFEPQVLFRILDIAFNILFTLELLLRWAADGLIYFFSCNNPSMKWNLFDFVLVAPTWLQEIVTVVMAAGDGGLDLNFMRLLRMMRLVRVARIIRVVRFFSELRVMVNCILGSGKSLLWAFLLLCLVMFTIGVVIMQFSAMYIDSGDAEKEVVSSLRELYGNLFRTMMTLFMVISGGIDWRDSVTPLRKVTDGFLELVMGFYVFFTTFCCLNIVTGIFVDNAKSLRMADEEAVFQEAMLERKRWISEVADLFSKLGSGKSSASEGFDFAQFQEQLGDMRVQTIFRKLGINPDTTSAEELWEILDADGSGNIDQEEFAKGIKHFHGDAKNIDVYRLGRNLDKLSKRIDQLSTAILSEGPQF